MLSIKNIKKIYKTGGTKENNVVALNDVSIDFPEKGLVFLIGKSGSGKSTLLNVIGGLDSFDEGEIIIKGKSSKEFSQSDFDSYRNTFVGFIFQDYNIIENFSVAKNLALAIELQGKKASKDEVNKLLAEVDLLEYGKRKPNQLSGGQKQRVAIARALIKNPEIIMADEPTGALDSNTGKQIMENLKKLSKEKLVIVVSHDREFAETYGDRIIELKDGKILTDVTKKEISAKQTESGMNIYDESIIYIKKGQIISEKNLSELTNFIIEKSKNSDTIISFDNDANNKMRTSAKINSDFKREKFVDTDKEDIDKKVYNEGSLKLIKSRLKFSDSLKMGVSSLKHKVGKLIFTILLSFVAFTIFGLVDTLSCWDRASSVYQTVEITNQKYVSIVKREKTDSYFEDTYTEDNDIEYLKNKFPNQFFKGIAGSSSFVSFFMDDEQIDLDNLDSDVYKYNPYYDITTISGYLTLNDDEIEKMGFELNGRLPLNDNEVCISQHFFDILKEFSATSDKKVTSFENLKIKVSNYNYLYTNQNENQELTVVGIIDDKTNLSKIKDIKSTTNADIAKLFMYKNLIDYGFSKILYVSAEKYQEIVNNNVSANFYICDANSPDSGSLYFSLSNLKSVEDAYSLFTNNDIRVYEYDKYDLYYYNYDYNKQWLIYDGDEPIYYYDINNNNLYNSNYEKLSEEEKNNFFNLYGGDGDSNLIPDNFVIKSNEMAFAQNYIAYYAGGDFIDNNGNFVTLNKDEILISKSYLENYIGADWKDKIDSGFEIAIKKSYSSDSFVKKYKVVGAINTLGYNYEYIVSSDTYDADMNGVYKGYSYVIAGLTGTSSDKEFIKFCETYDPVGVKYVVQNSATTVLDLLEEVIEDIKTVFLVIGIIFAVFASLLLMNFISISITYKKREIGVLRALGARGSDIFGIFFNESSVIAIINFVLSGIATILISLIINTSIISNIGFEISIFNPGIRQFLLILAISWGSAFVASFIPTMRISKKKPIDAINNR